MRCHLRDTYYLASRGANSQGPNSTVTLECILPAQDATLPRICVAEAELEGQKQISGGPRQGGLMAPGSHGRLAVAHGKGGSRPQVLTCDGEFCFGSAGGDMTIWAYPHSQDSTLQKIGFTVCEL